MSIETSSPGLGGLTPAARPDQPVDVAGRLSALRENVGRAFLGKPEVVRLAVVALLADGHLLLEDVPGVGKTLLAKALARSLDCRFSRVQFTPDLLPGDLLGVSVYREDTRAFEFRPGPVFAQTLLADEINRATPRTQAALLEAMAERRVSVDGNTYNLKPPFLVIATQNPIDQEGTFPLPEAQLDRFLVRLSLGYPSFEEEGKMLSRLQKGHPIDDLKPVVSADDWLACQEAVRDIHVDEKVKRYVLEIVHGSRGHEDVMLGGSPRASLALYRTAQALAAIGGRDFVLPDDVKKMAGPVLGHRLILKPESRLRKRTPGLVVAELVADAKVPVTDKQRAVSEDYFDR